MPVTIRAFISTIAAVAVAGAPALSAAAAGAMTRAEYEACQARDETAFRAAVDDITVKALLRGLQGFDYAAVVAEEWRRGNLDEIVDKRVDLAVAEVRDETSWGSLIRSLADREKAQEIATAVAERVYRSDAMKEAIEGLAVGVGREVGRTMELAAKDAAEPALQCLEAFLGARYGSTVARAVAGDAGKELGVDASRGGAEITSGAVLRESGQGIAGAAILLVRRQLANMAQRIGQRIVGTVLSRLVSVVAGGIGLVLIAKDLWDLRHGVLPIIATEMKSPETKDEVKAELARSIAEQIGEHVKEIAAKSADTVIAIWHDFRRAHARALELAERDEGFRRFLNSLDAKTLPRLDEVIAIVIEGEGESAVLRRLQDGTLNSAVNLLPAAGMEIARENRSIDAALKWWVIGGGDLVKVIDLELHRRTTPDSFTRLSLQRLLGLGDRTAITRLASVPREARDVLFELAPGELTTLARSLTETELATLARYLTGLEQGPRERVLRAVAASPARMQVLASDRVRDAIIASRDQEAAVGMMLRTDTGFGSGAIVEDLRLAWSGRVSPILILDRHPILVYLTLAAVVILLLALRRIFRLRRRTGVSPGASV